MKKQAGVHNPTLIPVNPWLVVSDDKVLGGGNRLS